MGMGESIRRISTSMNRRSHKKSRRGCRECKGRHIKCDERRPICGNCTVAERDCQFDGQPRSQPSPAGQSPLGSTSPVQPVAIVLQSDQAGLSLDAVSGPNVELGGAVNLHHMALLIHYSFSVSWPELGTDLEESLRTRLVLNMAVDFPWLLHEVLAISARHLATVDPQSKAEYHRIQAVQLQTRAIELFNGANLQINGDNCAAALTFSSILGRHMLVDALAGRDVGSFLERYCHYIEVHRGMRAVASDAWPMLIESNLQPLLSVFIPTGLRDSQGKELDDLRAWISRSSVMNQESIEACLEAVTLLQIGLDENEPSRSRTSKNQMVFLWPILSPMRFIDLIRQRQQEALVILGHYALLLHHARSLWQIGDSGARFFRIISEVLGSDCDYSFSWSRAIIFADDGG